MHSFLHLEGNFIRINESLIENFLLLFFNIVIFMDNRVCEFCKANIQTVSFIVYPHNTITYNTNECARIAN